MFRRGSPPARPRVPAYSSVCNSNEVTAERNALGAGKCSEERKVPGYWDTYNANVGGERIGVCVSAEENVPSAGPRGVPTPFGSNDERCVSIIEQPGLRVQAI